MIHATIEGLRKLATNESGIMNIDEAANGFLEFFGMNWLDTSMRRLVHKVVIASDSKLYFVYGCGESEDQD